MNCRITFPLIAVVAFLTLTPGYARGELPSIRFDRIHPLGATAGSTIAAEIGGSDIEDVQSIWFDHPGISAAPVEDKERAFTISIAADVPQGAYEARLVGRWGVSNPRLFAVSYGLKDLAETEPNNSLEQIQPIEINTAVGGMSDGNGQDMFRFSAHAGQRLVIDCQAGILDSAIDATMTLSLAGKQLASSSDYRGRDPLIDFQAPQDGDYDLLIHDLSYRGGLPYRLIVTDRPYVENVFPRAVQAGKATELIAFGRNFPAGISSKWSINDLPLAEQTFPVKPPDDILELGAYRFFEHPTGHSVLPTAATCTLTGFQVRPPFENSPFNAQTVLVTESPVTLETEPNNESNRPQAISIPAVVSGRFDRPRDADWFEFEVAEKGKYEMNVYCERIGGFADPYLVVVDEKDNRLNELDDFGHRINAFDGHLRDPVGLIDLNENRKYRVLIQDRYQRGGARYQYVLTIRKPQPDFYPAVIHSQNPGPGGTNLRRGGAVYLDAIIHQTGGFSEEITFTAEDLPPGVHSLPTVINNNSRGTFVLWADDNAQDFVGPIKLVATGKRGDETLRREVRAYTRVDSNMNSSQPVRSLLIGVREEAPYRLEWDRQNVEVESGKSIELKLKLTRRIPDWTNDVTIQTLAFPGNFKMANANITGNQTELDLTIDVQANTRPGSYTLAVLGQAQVPFNKDATAAEKPNTLVSLPSLPITVTVKTPTKTE